MINKKDTLKLPYKISKKGPKIYNHAALISKFKGRLCRPSLLVPLHSPVLEFDGFHLLSHLSLQMYQFSFYQHIMEIPAETNSAP